MGDVLIILTQLFVALYIFELLVRKSPSPISFLHHAGAVLIGQSAVALSLDTDKEVNATMEYVLCLVWGAFDVLSELWLNLAFILYRARSENHSLISYVFASTCIISIVGTVTETIIIMTLFGQSWNRWDLSFKIATPILHILFTVAQLHTAKILYVMWVKQKRFLAEKDRTYLDVERVVESGQSGNNEAKTETTTATMAEGQISQQNEPGGRDPTITPNSTAMNLSTGPNARSASEDERSMRKQNTLKNRIKKYFTSS